jgi:hypothetical protein
MTGGNLNTLLQPNLRAYQSFDTTARRRKNVHHGRKIIRFAADLEWQRQRGVLRVCR